MENQAPFWKAIGDVNISWKKEMIKLKWEKYEISKQVWILLWKSSASALQYQILKKLNAQNKSWGETHWKSCDLVLPGKSWDSFDTNVTLPPTRLNSTGQAKYHSEKPVGIWIQKWQRRRSKSGCDDEGIKYESCMESSWGYKFPSIPSFFHPCSS